MTEPNPSTEPNDPLAKQADGDTGSAHRKDEDRADTEDRSFHTSTVEANRAIEEGDGVGQRELDAQRDPNEDDANRTTMNQDQLDARTDMSRDNHQTPRGNDAVRDTDDNLP